MPYANLKDLKLYYEDFGRGEPILFLHSHFSRGILAFGAQIQPFQGKYRCIIPDFRGHGRTVCDDLTWDSERAAEDMIHFLDYLGIEKVHLLGYSMGTYVGMYLASRHQERVKSFTAIGASARPITEGAEEFLPERLMERKEIDFIEDMKIRHMDAHKGNWQEYLRQTVADWQAHPNLTEEEWSAIQCPTFFISGKNDPFNTCKELKEKCPHAEIYEVPGGGHGVHFIMEQGKEINQLILNFLKQTEEL